MEKHGFRLDTYIGTVCLAKCGMQNKKVMNERQERCTLDCFHEHM